MSLKTRRRYHLSGELDPTHLLKSEQGVYLKLIRFATFGASIIQFVIGSLLVESQFFDDRAGQVKTKEASQIMDANQRISQFDLKHFSMRELIVHQVFAIAFHAFTDFRVDQAKLCWNQVWSVRIYWLTGSLVGPPA